MGMQYLTWKHFDTLVHPHMGLFKRQCAEGSSGGLQSAAAIKTFVHQAVYPPCQISPPPRGTLGELLS